MFYDFSFTIPTTATKANPTTQKLQLGYGVVHEVTLFWWPGPHGLVHLIIERFGSQLLPTNNEGSFHYDNLYKPIKTRIELFEEPYYLKLKGWADGCQYDHEVIVGVGILPPECFPEYQVQETGWEKLKSLFGV